MGAIASHTRSILLATDLTSRRDRAFDHALGGRDYGIEHAAAADIIRDFIADRTIDLAVFRSHGRTGFRKAIMGSVAARLMPTVRCDALTVGQASERRG